MNNETTLKRSKLFRRVCSASFLTFTLVGLAHGDAMTPIISAAAQADLPSALLQLQALPAEGLSDKDAKFRSCVLDRFSKAALSSTPSIPSLPQPLAAVLQAYRTYWTSVLLKHETATVAEAGLDRRLAALMPDSQGDLEARTESAKDLAKRSGWHVLGGFTPPLHDFLLWKSETTRMEAVQLPERSIDVKISMLEDFVSFGWVGWATCDRAHIGGWATKEGIMVPAGWNTKEESFAISLQAHEAQHFADYIDFPDLAPEDLEYRAKLVELSLAKTTQRELLEDFVTGATPDRSLPHPFAQWWLVTRLSERLGPADWKDWSPDKVRAAAAAELRVHSEALKRQGKGVKTAIPDK
ncbi:hypothetical protein ACS5PN_26715 [Roseateles sp. NT4]|uniref:hypothetical protein n=1 Tax=Roseateles sp. NT4 TaxID=3453715 RepID=UPI003EEB114A